MANFTPQEIEQFLQEFFDTVGARQYIGARYIPIFGRAGSDTVEWDDTAPYEPLTVVMHDGVSYVSRRYVPAGIEISDTDYWVETYRFNAQVEQYRQQVLAMQDDVDNRIPFPDPDFYPRYGELGQVLSTLADGSVKWDDPVHVTSDVAEPLIEAWLDEHPEATTTVEDNSITDAKINENATILRFRGIPAGITTLAQVTKAGIWHIPTNLYDVLTDLPEDATRGAGSLYVLQSPISATSTTSPLQIYERNDNSGTWRRYVVNGTAQAWIRTNPTPTGRIADGAISDIKLADTSTILRNRGIPSDITSLAQVTEAGVYHIPTTLFNAVDDMPDDATAGSGSLYVLQSPISATSTTSPLQIYERNDNSGTWRRYVVNGTAQAWIRTNPAPTVRIADGAITEAKIADGSVSDAKLKSNATILRYKGIPSGISALYEITEAGVYHIPATLFNQMTDMPSDAASGSGALYVIQQPVSNLGQQSPLQIYERLNNSGRWRRYVLNGTPQEWLRTIPVPTERIANGAVTEQKLARGVISKSVLQGKKLVTAGDSFTQALFTGQYAPYNGKNYGYHVAQRHAMTLVNDGIHGTIIALDKTYVADPDNVDINTRQPFSYQRYQAVPNDTDYLTIAFGINDTSNTNLGTLADTTNETFYGAWNVVLEYYLTNRPFLHLGLIIMPRTGATYAQAIRDVAEKWGYPVWDLINDKSIPAFFEREDMSSDAETLRKAAYGWDTFNRHPNPEWHEFISGAYEKFLMGL